MGKNELAARITSEAAHAVAEAHHKQEAARAMVARIDNAQCSRHSGCHGLSGYCCPTLNLNRMHLGSQRLDGENLGCCGASQELVTEAAAPASRTFSAANMLFAAFTGSALTAVALRFLPGKGSTIGPAERLIA